MICNFQSKKMGQFISPFKILQQKVESFKAAEAAKVLTDPEAAAKVNISPKEVEFLQRAAEITPAVKVITVREWMKIYPAATSYDQLHYLIALGGNPEVTAINTRKTYEGLPDDQKATYLTTIQGFVSIFSEAQWDNVVGRMSIPAMSWYINTVAPGKVGWLEHHWIKKDLNGWLRMVTDYAQNLDEMARADYWHHIKTRLELSAPDWEGRIIPSIKQKLIDIFIPEAAKEEIRTAAFMPAGAGRLIGLLVIGAFGLWAFTALAKRPARKK
jgi:hypothetical protein